MKPQLHLTGQTPAKTLITVNTASCTSSSINKLPQKYDMTCPRQICHSQYRCS